MSSPGSSKKCPWAGPAKISVAVLTLELSASPPFTSPYTVSGPASKELGLACRRDRDHSHMCACQGTQMEDSEESLGSIQEEQVCGPGESRGALCDTVSPLLSSPRYSELPESYGQFLWAPKVKWCWHPLQAGRKQWGFHRLRFLEKPPCCVWSHVLQSPGCHSPIILKDPPRIALVPCVQVDMAS